MEIPNRQAQIEALQKTITMTIAELKKTVSETTIAHKSLQSSLEKNLGGIADRLVESVTNAANTAIDELYEQMQESVEKWTTYDISLKKRLNASAKNYNQSLNILFNVDNKRHAVFFIGMYCNIATAIMLFLFFIFENLTPFVRNLFN